MQAEKRAGDAVKDAKGRDSGEHGFDRGPLARIGPVVHQGQHSDIPQMESSRAMGKQAEAEPIQGHRPVVALLHLPDAPALTKPFGRRRLKVTRTAPITATARDKDPFQGIGTVFSHLRPPFVVLRCRNAVIVITSVAPRYCVLSSVSSQVLRCALSYFGHTSTPASAAARRPHHLAFPFDDNSLSNSLASCRSLVSNPSVNQP